MPEDREDLLQRIFDRVLETPSERRAEAVDRECGSDEALRHEVRSLLASHDAAPEDFLERPHPLAARRVVHESEDVAWQPGDRIDGFVIRRRLGTGGAGDVFLAEQDAPQRAVALKVLRPALLPEIANRFRFEARILANVNHPNVAKVFSTGETADGRPYMALEYVEGHPLTRYCEERQLAVNDRLRLFLRVCAAFEHVHRIGIIHRDVKPDNIVVTELDGAAVPKLIDFGIAKSVQAVAAMPNTASGTLLGTLNYCSPEQLHGEGTDACTDVYSLGVVLYELLTGHRPFDAAHHSLSEFCRIVREKAPQRPTQCLSRVRGAPGHAAVELDWVVLRTLAKDPADRYQSVAELRQEIERFLDGHAVHAHPPSAAYLFRKAVSRHRGIALAGLTLLLALAIGAAATLWQARTANQYLTELQRVAATLVTGLGDMIDVPGATRAKAQLVESAAETLARIQTSGRMEGIEDQVATALEQIGRLRADPYSASLGETAAGIDDLAQAVALRRTSHERRGSAESAIALAQALFTFAIVCQSSPADARRGPAATTEAIELCELALEREPSSVDAVRVLTMCLDLRAEHVLPRGMFDEVEALLHRSYDLRVRWTEKDPSDEEARRLVGGSLGRLAYATQDPAVARELALRALVIHEKYFEVHPFSYRAHLDLSFAYRNAAYGLRANGDLEEARRLQERGLQVRRTMAQSDSSDKRSRVLLSEALHLQGESLVSLGEADTAIVVHRHAFEMANEIARRPSAPPWIHAAQLHGMLCLARAHRTQGNLDSARAYYARVNAAPSGELMGVRAWRDRIEEAHTLWEAGDVATARDRLRSSTEVLEEIERSLRRNNAHEIPFGDLALGYLHVAQTWRDEEPQFARRMVERADSLPVGGRDRRPVRALVLNELACALADAGEPARARELLAAARGAELDGDLGDAVTWNLRTVEQELAHADVRFRTTPYDPARDPYARIYRVLFRRWVVWGEHPSVPPSRRVPVADAGERTAR